MKRILYAIVSVSIVTSSLNVAADNFKRRGLIVRKHVNLTNYTEEKFDKKLEGANGHMLNYTEYPNHPACNDAPCNWHLGRYGDMGTFGSSNDGLDTIDNEAELDAVMRRSAGGYVVSSISYCGGKTGHFDGCAETNSPINGSFADVWIIVSGASGLTIAHEVIHNFGREHMQDCPYNVMYGSIPIGTCNVFSHGVCEATGAKSFVELSGEVADGPKRDPSFIGPLEPYVDDDHLPERNTGPYWIRDTIFTAENNTLTVQPGTLIIVNQGEGLYATGNSSISISGGSGDERTILVANKG